MVESGAVMPEKWLIVVTVALVFTLAVLAWSDEISDYTYRLKRLIADNPVSRWLRRELRRRRKQSFDPGISGTGGGGGRLDRVGDRVPSGRWRPRGTDWEIAMQIGVSVALLGVGLYVILSKQYAAADTNWAYGTVGTVVGYWLKGR